jgi:hypothetical protein
MICKCLLFVYVVCLSTFVSAKIKGKGGKDGVRAFKYEDLKGILSMDKEKAKQAKQAEAKKSAKKQKWLAILADYYGDEKVKLDKNLIAKSKFVDANDALETAQTATRTSYTAIQAAASALASCQISGEIDCQQLMDRYGQSSMYIDVASTSQQSAQAQATAVVETARRARRYGKKDDTLSLINSHLADVACGMAQHAVEYAEISAMVAATASAQCGIMMNIKCNTCPQASFVAPAEGVDQV